ncbi:alpha-L-fucosidase [Clostridia bacterium]|nr:alpha-L-fucosidase [Clostridia bacterium]
MAKFEATFDSLKQFTCPDWFRDAKFGIWSHWGPQSVPMAGDWYARNIYIQGSEQYNYHIRHYGHPSKFGYKDIATLWKAEKFNPDELMELYVAAGAKYFVGQATHHDHFFNYPSKINAFNSAKVGPMKDISGLWKAAAKKKGLPFGLTEHLSAGFSWLSVTKGADTYGPYEGVPYDGADPKLADIYYSKEEQDKQPPDWYTTNKWFHQYWLDCMKELIDIFEPDLLYSDGGLPFGDHTKLGLDDEKYKVGLEAVAYLYNKSIEKNGSNIAVYNQKTRDAVVYKVGILDIEKSQLPGIAEDPWQTDTCIGNWFYDAKQKFKKPGQIIDMLIDIVAKNGSMLLNILQRPDGTIDEETKWILDELASWIKIGGAGIYGSRPWRQSGEGFSSVEIKGFTENAVNWTSADYRFTKNGNRLYAYFFKAPENGAAAITSLTKNDKVESVRLLGHGYLPFNQEFGPLVAQLPDKLPTKYANCLEITLK